MDLGNHQLSQIRPWTSLRIKFLLPALIAGLGLVLAGRVSAQTFTTLHSFAEGSGGHWPHAGLVLSGNTLYGTATYGGDLDSNDGTVFKVNTDGSDFTILHSFTALSGALPIYYDNSDGAYAWGGLVLSGNTLYGTAASGGSWGRGTVFAVNTDGTGFTNLHSFHGSDGNYPYAGFFFAGATLYGTASGSGSSTNGTVFKVTTDGTGFTTLHSFTATSGSSSTNSEGADPRAGLILSGNTLYGTADRGGSSGTGTVFKVNTDGTGFANLHSFTVTPYPDYTNSDGAGPKAGLILLGNTLYGTAVGGGRSGKGTVFAVNTDGTDFTILHSFTATSAASPYTNSDGATPYAGLLLSGNTLYGAAHYGGRWGNGTVFALNTDGTGFTNLYSFTARSGFSPTTNTDGAYPWATLILSGNTLYGTALVGGTSGNGTVFSLSFPAPQLTIIRSGTNVVLTWPTYAPGVTLQSTTNLVSPAVWTTVSPGPTLANGQNAVTNAISATKKFFRLSQ